MKLKAAFLLPGVIALTLAAAPIIAPLIAPANAQDTQNTQDHHQWKKGGFWDKLNLTPDQKNQIKQIRESAKQQRDAIFTPEQKTALQQARQQHKRPQLNLSSDQKAQLKQIHESTRSQIKALLTPQQQQQLEQMRAQWKQNHPGHSGHGGQSN